MLPPVFVMRRGEDARLWVHVPDGRPAPAWILAEDGDTSAGSFYFLEAPDRQTVVDFNRNDPFTKNGVWDKVEINAFLRRAP